MYVDRRDDEILLPAAQGCHHCPDHAWQDALQPLRIYSCRSQGRAEWEAGPSRRQRPCTQAEAHAGGRAAQSGDALAQTRALADTLAADKDGKFAQSKFLQFLSKMSRGEIILEGNEVHLRHPGGVLCSCHRAAAWKAAISHHAAPARASAVQLLPVLQCQCCSARAAENSKYCSIVACVQGTWNSLYALL